MASSSREPKHVWTKEEEATLVECLVELVSAGRWRSNNGTFRPCYLAQLEQMMAAKLPGRLFQATISSGSKQKRGGLRVADVDLIHEAMEYVNGQLRAIAEWPSVTLQNETAVCQEVLCQLRVILELSRLDRTRCAVWTTCEVSLRWLRRRRWTCTILL
ncbi:retrotransposon protein [Cucumis melo var. makuwa]|uniref:Retrotransposon protein n=1 Tax=Cucumis melo var. makuwa TaxID=1194695 RepID=A0A5D3DUT7_CUCMM|nr:retrotransposon protein [Cucumis melo var. makuwa]TYK27085.1 retrotransposon protein [Cucumis melo var. makuwa]